MNRNQRKTLYKLFKYGKTFYFILSLCTVGMAMYLNISGKFWESILYMLFTLILTILVSLYKDKELKYEVFDDVCRG